MGTEGPLYSVTFRERVKSEAQRKLVPLSLVCPWVSGRKKGHKVRAPWLDPRPHIAQRAAAAHDTCPLLPNSAS